MSVRAFSMAKKRKKDVFKILEKKFDKADEERKEREMWAKPGSSDIGGKKRYWTNG